MRENNIYYNLIKNEDTFTEAFVNLLVIDEIRHSFLEFIKTKIPCDGLDFEFLEIDTQVIGKNSERPDIVLRNDNVLLVIENKINIYTNLTKNQRDGYLKFFKQEKQKNKILLFTIPTTYKHRPDLVSQIDKLKTNDVKIKIIIWEELLDNISESSKQKYFKDFISIAKYFCNYKLVNIQEKDVKAISDPESYIKLYRTIENLKKLLRSDGKKVIDDKNEYSYGIYIDNNDDKLYIGIVYDNWIQYGEPIYLGFDKKSKTKITTMIKKEEDIDPEKSDDEWQYVVISLKSLSDQTEAAEYIKSKITKYMS